MHTPCLQIHGQVMLESFQVRFQRGPNHQLPQPPCPTANCPPQGFTFMQALRFQRDLLPVMRRNMGFLSECAPYRLNALVGAVLSSFNCF